MLCRINKPGRWPAVMALLLSALAGCGDDWKARTYPATGRLTINGEPAEGALVQLHRSGKPADERNSIPWGRVGADGAFTLSTYEAGDGAPAGAYVATITWPPDTTRPSLEDRLGRRFAQPSDSTWNITIDEAATAIPPRALENVRLTETAARPGKTQKRGQAGPPMPGLTNTPTASKGRK